MDGVTPGDAPSPTKNLVTGGGCGCGCLGGMLSLAGGIAVVGVPLGFYAASMDGSMTIVGGLVVSAGVLMAVVGTVAYVAGSLFIE